MKLRIALSAASALFAAGLNTAHAEAPQTGSGTGTAIAEPLAQPPQAPVFSFNLTGASNYVFRGVSQTENDPAIFGSAKVSYDQFYAAVGGENVNFHNGIDAEYDMSAGWTPSVGEFNFDVGAIRYGYVNAPAHTDIDTTEIRGAVSRKFGDVKIGAALNYAIDYFGSKKDGTYVEGNASYAITDQLTASGAVGHQAISAGNDFAMWNMGASYAFTKNIALDLRYLDTDGHRFGNLYRSHYVAALKLSL
jgi:uncharacterized protein (TIGR02001 family)